MDLAGFLWLLTLVVAAFTLISALLRARLMSMRFVTPATVNAPTAKPVMVGGIARPIDGVQPAPLTGEPVLLGIGTRVEEVRDSRGDDTNQTRTETHPAGRTDTRFAIIDEHVPQAWVLLDSSMVSRLTAPTQRIDEQGGGVNVSIGPVSFRGGGRVHYEERVVRDGDRVWAAGSLLRAPDGTVHFDGRVALSDRSPQRQIRSRTQAVIAFAVVAGFLAIVAALATAGVLGD